MMNELYHGDCLEILPTLPNSCVDLVVTSPPYADSRKSTYGGIGPDRYVEWFLPISAELRRILKDEGSFVLNIKERVVGGERHTYVLELIIALRRQGWLWTEEYMWHKKNCAPGKWPNRFRDQEAVMVPTGDWAKFRLRKLGNNDVVRFNSQVGSGFGKNIANWVGREMAYPTNVLHMATECGNKNHSATFPKELPSWFIRLFTNEGDVVLDPFMGSGTTSIAAYELGRGYTGIELKDEYYREALSNINDAKQIPVQRKLI
jgi:DNA modification methylase